MSNNNEKLEGEVMIQWMMARFKQTRAEALASMPPEVRKNFDTKGNEFLNKHLEIIHTGE
jgi:hypothetical protein|tara:strand:- start:229 stop:408 length:180 start_codon:yes stop_codon:yes gene_type:complete